MEASTKTLKLNSGEEMPIMGLGTYLSFDKEQIIKNVEYAIMEWGYRHIDTAQAYENEEAIGEAVQNWLKKGIKREDLFITTKMFNKTLKKDTFRKPEDESHSKTEENDPETALKASLARLKLDYVDLYHAHWCTPMIDFETMEVTGPSISKVWESLEDLVDKGLTKSIGVCNCNVMTLLNILAEARIKPAVVQVELHPYLHQEGLVNTCQRFGIQVTAMAPLGAPGFPYTDMTKTKILEHETIKEISEKHKCTPAQVSLAWNLGRNVSVIPKSTSNERIKENMEALGITLDQEDLTRIKEMNINLRSFDPGNFIEPESGWFNLSDFD